MKLLFNQTYFSNESPKHILEVFDHPDKYENYIFNISTINLGDLSEPIWYVCMFKKITIDNNTRYAFIPLFDNHRNTFLKNFSIIDSYLVDNFMVYEWEVFGNPIKDEGFAKYKLPIGAYMDYDNRTNEKDGTFEVSVFYNGLERKLVTKDWKELVLV